MPRLGAKYHNSADPESAPDEAVYGAAEDSVRAILDSLKWELASIRRLMETSDEPHPGLGRLASSQEERLGRLEDAIYFGGNRWLVALHAMYAGQGDTLLNGYLTEHGLRKRIDAMAPDASRGRKVLDSARKGGRERLPITPAEVRAAVEAERNRMPGRSDDWIFKGVAARLSASKSTIKRRLAEVP
jgi:hypothetical protein